MSEQIPLSSTTTEFPSYLKSVFDMCDKNGDNYANIKDIQDYVNSPRGRHLTLPPNKVEAIDSIAQNYPERIFDFEEFVNLMSNDDNSVVSAKKRPHRKRGFMYWTNKYVNIVVPRKKKPKKVVPKGRRLVRSTQLLQDESDDESYMDEFSCCPPPITMLLISILEITFHVIDEVNQPNSTYYGIGITGRELLYDPARRYEAWRYLTYMFVHIGWSHLIINVIFQILVGLPLEMVHHWWRILSIYVAGVLAGSLASSVVDPRVKVAGASGGVYALMTAHIATIILNWSEMSFPAIQLFIALVLVGGDLVPAIYNRYYLDIEDSVSSIGHLGGATAGLLVGIYILRNLKETPKERYLWWYALVLYVMLMTTAVALNIFLPLSVFGT